MFKSVICLSVTHMYVYCLEMSLAASGVCYMGRSGNTPSGYSLMFCWLSPQLRGLCINEPTSASMHNKPLRQESIFLHMPTVMICYLIWPCDTAVHITYLFFMLPLLMDARKLTKELINIHKLSIIITY